MLQKRIVILLVILLNTPVVALSEECSFDHWIDYKGDRLPQKCPRLKEAWCPRLAAPYLGVRHQIN